MKTLMLGWTTVDKEQMAQDLARKAVTSGLAACVQVEGPITSHFAWEGKQQVETEFRLCFKYLSTHAKAVEDWLRKEHPYDEPEWVVVRADRVSEGYLDWTIRCSGG